MSQWEITGELSARYELDNGNELRVRENVGHPRRAWELYARSGQTGAAVVLYVYEPDPNEFKIEDAIAQTTWWLYQIGCSWCGEMSANDIESSLRRELSNADIGLRAQPEGNPDD